MLVPRLTHVPMAERQAMREGPRDSATHMRHAAAIPALGEIEIGGRTSRDGAGESLTVMAWNVERLRHVQAIAETIAAQAPDVVLLTEVDKGMARSGNGHPLSLLAIGSAMPLPMASSSSSWAPATRRSSRRPAKPAMRKASTATP